MLVLVKLLFLTMAPCDAAKPWQLGSQDPVTPILIDSHHDVKRLLVFVLCILVRALWHFHYAKLKIQVLRLSCFLLVNNHATFFSS